MTPPSLREVRRGPDRAFVAGAGHRRRDGKHWRFTERLSALADPDQIADAVSREIVAAGRATNAAVYLADARATVYRLSATLGHTPVVRTIHASSALPTHLQLHASALPVRAERLPTVAFFAVPASLVIPIRWRAALIGFVVVGPERTGAHYTAQDREFLAGVAMQAAPFIAALRVPEVATGPSVPRAGDRLTMAVAHDVKNAVSALSLLTRNALENLGDPEFQRDAVRTLSAIVARMQRLLVKLSSPDEERPPRPEAIDLYQLIVKATASLAARGKVKLIRRLQPVGSVYGHHDALVRVIENLTTNAVEAIDGEGTVTVTLTEQAGCAVISVADTGSGISDEARRHLFAPFQSTKRDGWGIGLYHTKQVVERHGGQIRVESREGGGTTFTVTLPVRPDVATATSEGAR